MNHLRQFHRAVHASTRAIDAQEDGVHRRIDQRGAEVAADELGRGTAADLAEQVHFLAHDAIDRHYRHAVDCLVTLRLVLQRLAELGFERLEVDFFAPQMPAVDRLNLEQFVRDYRPGAGQDVDHAHRLGFSGQ